MEFQWTPGIPGKAGAYLVSYSDGRVDALLGFNPSTYMPTYRIIIAYAPLPAAYVPPKVIPQVWRKFGSDYLEFTIRVTDEAPELAEPQPLYVFWWSKCGDSTCFVEILPALRDAVTAEANKFGQLSDGTFCTISCLYDVDTVMTYLSNFANQEWEKLQRE